MVEDTKLVGNLHEVYCSKVHFEVYTFYNTAYEQAAIVAQIHPFLQALQSKFSLYNCLFNI